MKHQVLLLCRKIFMNNPCRAVSSSRSLSTQEAIERRNHLFTLEKKRQHEKIGRIEKIEVNYKGLPKNCTFIMNKGISTPYDCAKHLTEWHTETNALALIDGAVLWDMHRPLTENCTLELQHFMIPEPQQVNKAFWRSCSFLLGACATIAFKESVPLLLHSFPGPDIRSGSFIYDVELPTLPDWKPSSQELFTLSAEYLKLCRQNLRFERLEVSEQLALEMFQENPHKVQQIPNIAKNHGKVILYRAGTHVDISRGPLVSCTSHVGKVTVSAVHKLAGSPDSGVKQLYRLQGVALPKAIIINHFAYSILIERSRKLNPARSPINSAEKDNFETEKVAARA